MVNRHEMSSHLYLYHSVLLQHLSLKHLPGDFSQVHEDSELKAFC